MTKEALLGRMTEIGIVAVVRTPSPDTAQRAVEACIAGGLNTVEVTFTVPNAVDVIKALAASVGSDVILGAGTVTDAQKAKMAIEAGARFIVAPNTDPDTIRMAASLDAVTIPGALTPTEVVIALNAGADAVKIFPASAFGPSYIKAIRGPLPDVKFVPTGGINLENIPAYVKAGAAMFGIGGNLVDLELIKAGNYGAIADRARAYVETVQRARAEL